MPKRVNRLASPFANPNIQGMNQDDFNTQELPPLEESVPVVEPPKPKPNYAAMFDQPDGPVTKQYRDFLAAEAPTKEQFKPGKIDRIAAILSGVGEGISSKSPARGYSVMQSILDEPYKEAVSKYQDKNDRLSKGAKLEGDSSDHRRQIAKDILDYQHKDTDDERSAKLADVTERNSESAIAKRNADLLAAGWNKSEDDISGETIYTKLNPITGQIETRRGPKTKLTPNEIFQNRSKELEFSSKLTEGRQNRGRAQGLENSRTLAKESDARRDENFTSDEAARAARPPSPTQEYTARINAMNKAIESGEATAKDFDSTTGNAKTAKARTARDKYLAAPKPKTDNKTTSPKVGTQVVMLDPQGKAWNVDAAEVDESTKHGWKVK